MRPKLVMRSIHRFAAVGGALILASAAALSPAGASDPSPVRSGTILNAFVMAKANACAGYSLDPECAAWISTRCDPMLSGRNPALFMSIEDVSELTSQPRRFFDASLLEAAGLRAGWAPGGVAVQFWSAGCRSLYAGPSPYLPWPGWSQPVLWFPVAAPPTVIEIPAGARWMTVRAYDGTPVMWSLS